MPAKALRCRVGIHKWVLRTSTENGAFHECARCGKMGTSDWGPPVGGTLEDHS
jgi:hypothetical protein